MHVTLLNASHPEWGSELERIGIELGAGNNPDLFPYHFLYVTLSRIGGHLALFGDGQRRTGVGFLFPRGLAGQPPRRSYTLRYHPLPGVPTEDHDQAADLCAAALDGAEVIRFDAGGKHAYDATHNVVGAVDIGRPGAEEAAAIRTLQQTVWGSPPEFLYPADVHSTEFGAGSSLVARVDGALAGFLFGFYKFGGPPLPATWEDRLRTTLRLESQTLAVHPAYRGLRIAFLIKRMQAEVAWQQGIDIVNWTADPLQYPNAALNFGLLRAVAFEFTPNLYPFRNELNRVHASRLSLTWLVSSHRVRRVPLVGAQAEVIDLRGRRQIPRTNDGLAAPRFDLDARVIAIEVPADWTARQQADVAQAQAWRILTDSIFAHYLGSAAGQYVLTGVGTDGERRYLVAEQADASLWERLGRADDKARIAASDP